MSVRIFGFPVKYYDDHVFSFIRDQIGKIVKLDKNTISREMGKYACLCIQVDLTKSLLEMFSIKGKH